MPTNNHPLWFTFARAPRQTDMHQPLAVGASVGIRFAQHGVCIVGGQA